MNDRRYVFHFRPKPKPKLEKHLALGRIPKPKVQIYIKMGVIWLKFNVSNQRPDQYTYQVSVYWYWYFLFWFSNTGNDTSYFKNILKYWYFSILFIISISNFLKKCFTRMLAFIFYFLHIITNTVPDPIFIGCQFCLLQNLLKPLRNLIFDRHLEKLKEKRNLGLF